MGLSSPRLSGSGRKGQVIIRLDGDEHVCISQPAHAALAHDIMRAWQVDGLRDASRREEVLFAIAQHDNGWIEEDDATHVDGDGRPLDFVTVPAAVKHRIWPRAVARVAPQHPYAAALIAQHALTVFGPYREEAQWRPFFSTMQALRDACLARADGGAAGARFDADYRLVRLGDLLSLVFCNGWTEPHDLPGGGRTILTGALLHVTPDPFGGARVPLRVPARRIAARRYASAADLRAALAAARPEVVEGHAAGAS
jgi:hypothetical protein